MRPLNQFQNEFVISAIAKEEPYGSQALGSRVQLHVVVENNGEEFRVLVLKEKSYRVLIARQSLDHKEGESVIWDHAHR